MKGYLLEKYIMTPNNLLYLKLHRAFFSPMIFLKMKLIAILFFATLVQVNASSFAQRITLTEKNASLEAVLKKIRLQTGYDILFQDKAIKNANPVSVTLKNVAIGEAFNSILKGQDLTYTITENTIVLKANEVYDSPYSLTGKAIDVEGTVLNENGTPLAGATVQVKGMYPIYTNVAGKFSIKGVEENAKIKITYLGCKDAVLSAAEIKAKPKVILVATVTVMDETVIRSKRPTGTKVDLKYRQHLNLAQVLQGTVPGLVIKSQRTISESTLYDTRKIPDFPSANVGFKHGIYTSEQLKQVWNEWATTIPSGKIFSDSEWIANIRRHESRWESAGAVVRTQSYGTEGLVPELRGAGGFPGVTQGMLIVIDGFVQKEFPADYPMNNVANIEVVKDPAETIKWGPEGLNGVILITTTRSTSNKMDISYNSNFSFSKARDNSVAALRLANAAQVLDYYLEAADKKILNLEAATNGLPPLNPALTLLYQREQGTPEQQQAFQAKWNALAAIGTVDHSKILQQNSFLQNHNLRFAGGIGNAYKYNINGTYGFSQNEALGNKNNRLALNMTNQFSLLKNKLQINWLLNAYRNRGISGTYFDINRLQPYQQLYNPDGSYAYDYTRSAIGQDQDAALLASGLPYLHSGGNPLEDALLNKTTKKSGVINTQLGIDWRILPELNFSTSLFYERDRSTDENFQDQASSQARRIYNTYGAYDQRTKQALFFVPQGHIFTTSHNNSESMNLRTGLSYNKVFLRKHYLGASLGVAGFNSNIKFLPNYPIYGYDVSTQQGKPLLVPENIVYYDYFGFQVYPTQLQSAFLDNKIQQRNLSVNTGFKYAYDERYTLDSYYNQSFMPVNNENIYTSTSNANAIASWVVNKEHFFNIPYISRLKLAVGAGRIKMASLPVQIQANRIPDTEWGLNTINITGYNAIRQNGLVVTNYDALFDLGLSEDRFQLQFNYRRNSQGVKNQLSGRVSYDISREPFFKIPAISTLSVEAFLTNMSPGQAIAQMMGTNSPNAGGGFFTTTGNMSLGLLPPEVINKELHLNIGFFKDRLMVDLRRYHRLTAGLGNGFVAAEPATGFALQAKYSELVNKGWEMFLTGKILKNNKFNWTATINGSYNVNLAQELPKINFSNTPGYMTARREGYATDNLWSYKWAGLSDKGEPQVYNEKGEAVIARSNNTVWNASNDTWLEYSGRTLAPWNVALLQDFNYKGVFARLTVLSSFGHVMRRYMPVASAALDNSMLIGDRWRKAGDEKNTDIAGMATADALRSLVIKNSNNTILPADFIRLQEVMLGYTLSDQVLKSRYMKNLWVSFQVQNLGLIWAKNKSDIDPGSVSQDGRILAKRPVTYGLSLNVTF